MSGEGHEPGDRPADRHDHGAEVVAQQRVGPPDTRTQRGTITDGPFHGWEGVW